MLKCQTQQNTNINYIIMISLTTYNSKQSQLKFITTTKYDAGMFAVVNISANQKDFFKVKPYKNKDYVFIPLRKIVKNKQLTYNTQYTVAIKDWIYEKNDKKYYCMKYYLNKV